MKFYDRSDCFHASEYIDAYGTKSGIFIFKKFIKKDLVESIENFLNSETEKEISILILRGLSNQQIAGLRGKSLKTIENQTFSIFQKSGTTGKLEFIAYFLSPLLPEED